MRLSFGKLGGFWSGWEGWDYDGPIRSQNKAEVIRYTRTGVPHKVYALFVWKIRIEVTFG